MRWLVLIMIMVIWFGIIVPLYNQWFCSNIDAA